MGFILLILQYLAENTAIPNPPQALGASQT